MEPGHNLKNLHGLHPDGEDATAPLLSSALRVSAHRADTVRANGGFHGHLWAGAAPP